MLERFTDRARNVLKMAVKVADEFGHTHVGTEHVLVAITREQSNVAVHVLKGMGVVPAQVEVETRRLLGVDPAKPTACVFCGAPSGVPYCVACVSTPPVRDILNAMAALSRRKPTESNPS